MTLVAAAITPQRIALTTDSAATHRDHGPQFVSKAHSLPTAGVVLTGRGQFQILDEWRSALDYQSLDGDLDTVAAASKAFLSRYQRVLDKHFERRGPSGGIIHNDRIDFAALGWSRGHESLGMYMFSTANGFEPQWVPPVNLWLAPHADIDGQVTPDAAGMSYLMRRQYDTTVDHLAAAGESTWRAGGGPVHLHEITRDGIVFRTVGALPNYGEICERHAHTPRDLPKI